jgi:hypothetical protein
MTYSYMYMYVHIHLAKLEQTYLHVVSRRRPFAREEGSGTAPLPELFCSPEILGNMNMQICGCSVIRAPYTYRTCSVY